MRRRILPDPNPDIAEEEIADYVFENVPAHMRNELLLPIVVRNLIQRNLLEWKEGIINALWSRFWNFEPEVEFRRSQEQRFRNVLHSDVDLTQISTPEELDGITRHLDGLTHAVVRSLQRNDLMELSEHEKMELIKAIHRPYEELVNIRNWDVRQRRGPYGIYAYFSDIHANMIHMYILEWKENMLSVMRIVAPELVVALNSERFTNVTNIHNIAELREMLSYMTRFIEVIDKHINRSGMSDERKHELKTMIRKSYDSLVDMNIHYMNEE